MSIDVDVTEMAHDSRLQFFASYVLDGLIARGLVRSPRVRRILDREEQRLVAEMRAKGLCSFENEEFEAAILWVAAGAGITLDQAKLRKELGYVLGG
jgi:hypothetical protein